MCSALLVLSCQAEMRGLVPESRANLGVGLHRRLKAASLFMGLSDTPQEVV